MKRLNRLYSTSFVSLLIFLLIISTLISPLQVSATEKNNVMVNLKEGTKVVVSDKVNEAFKEKEYVELIVEMREQVSTAKVAEKSHNRLQSTNMSKAKQELMTRYDIVNALKTTATNTQKSLLQKLENSSQVKDVRSFYIMNVIYLNTTKEMVEEIKKHPEVARIQLDRKIEVNWPEVASTQTEVDHHVKAEQISASGVEWNIEKVHAPKVWNEFGIDGSGVVVGVIDSGATWTHEALKEKWRGYNPEDPNNPNPAGNWYDAVNGDSMPYDIAAQPHGTHVLGTILGQDPDGENKVGVAPGAKWIAAKAFTVQGGQTSWLLAAGEFMLAPNDDPSLAPDIINNSWGGGAGLDEWYRPMVQAWRDAGILPVFAAGNDYPSKVSAPANYPESYAVAATDINNQRGSFSNVGPGPYDGDLKPDISAPGVNIRSSVPNGYAGGWNGTSMATPHISGVAALLKSVDASLTVNQIEQIINETSTSLTDNQYPEAPNYGYGNGLINAYMAVSSIASSSGAITGQVLKQGVDKKKPIISHEPFKFGYRGLDVTLNAQVTDNTSVDKVELYVRKDSKTDWEIVRFDRVNGSFLDGNYQVDVPINLVKDPGFQYKIMASDFSGNSSKTSIFDVEISFGIDPSKTYENSFEKPVEGMILSGDWERGTPKVGPTPTAGDQLVATKLDGNYSNQSNSILQLPPIDLRNVEDASLSFKNWYDIEYKYDVGKVLITDDINGEWQLVDTFTGRERTWNDYSISLKDYANSENQVFVALMFTSDGQVNEAGWYVDELKITNSSNGSTNATGKPVTINQQKTTTTNSPKVSKENNEVIGLPVEALVTVVETGRTVKTSLEDGTYRILHQPTPDGESYTLQVESYGYYPEQESFQLKEEQVIERNFLLTEIPKGEISLKVIDKETKEPLSDVQLEILEDSRIDSVATNSEGTANFTKILEGKYTVSASKANYQFEKEKVDVVGSKTSTITIELEPFPGSIISYDDGTAENARSFREGGYGFATKMTPDQLAKIQGASVYLWGEDWPLPGGNEFSVAVYESNDDGSPGKRIIDPKIVEGVRGQWNYVDLSEHGFETDKDYFVAVFQTKAFPDSPGLGIDETAPFADRTYQIDGNGVFEKLDASYGNYMIRSHVQYTTSVPILDGTEEPNYVNDDSYVISGAIDEDGIVKIYSNDKLVASKESSDQFELEVPLNEGENSFTATLTVNGVESSSSKALSVIKDTKKPEIAITSPDDHDITNKETITVTGQVTDSNFNSASLNGKEITLNEDGSFEKGMKLTEGVNDVSLSATDLAGNKSESVIEVELDTVAPRIEKITPEKDIEIVPGEKINLSMKSDTSGGAASAVIKDKGGKVITELSLTEKEKFTYKVDWTIPEDSTFETASFHFELVDDAGNKSSKIANGKLHLIIEKISRIFGDNRYDTAIKVSNEGWQTSDVVILARGDEFADTLAGIPLAHKLDAPVLLTKTNELYEGTKAELERLKAKKVVILGGEDAINQSMENDLKKMGIVVERIAGQVRSETAALITDRLDDNTDEVIVVNGLNFPDALSVASFAATEEIPILLTRIDRLPEATKNSIDKHDFTKSIVIGGPAVVSNDIFEKLPNATRISGLDRFKTNIEIWKHFSPSESLSHAYVATGWDFADGLTGATLAAKKESGILLVGDKVTNTTEHFIRDNTISRLTLFGGEQAISESVFQEFKNILD